MIMEKEICNFDIGGLCYAPKCFSGIHCDAKMDAGDNGMIMYASEEQKKRRSMEVFPEVRVMEPTVVNVSSSENVASEGQEYDSEQSVIIPKIDTVL